VAKFAGGVLIAVSLLGAPPAALGQPVAGDRLITPWTSHRPAADRASTELVIVAIAIDTWHAAHASDPKRALWLEAARQGCAQGSSQLVKRVITRTRPDGSDRQSFWSAHTATTAATIGGVRVAISVPLTIGVGYLRIAAGKHWLTDTLAGGVVGYACSFVR